MAEPPAPDDQSVWGDFETTSDRLYMIGLNGRGQTVLRNLVGDGGSGMPGWEMRAREQEIRQGFPSSLPVWHRYNSSRNIKMKGLTIGRDRKGRAVLCWVGPMNGPQVPGLQTGITNAGCVSCCFTVCAVGAAWLLAGCDGSH